MSEQSKKIVYEGKFLRYILDDTWEYVERHNCSGIVIIVPVTVNQELIFVEQYRYPVKSNTIEFPAGLADDQLSHKNEGFVQAAKRELLEETGYKAEQLINIYTGPVAAGSNADLVTAFLAPNVEKIAEGGGVEDESIVVHCVKFSEVDNWLSKQEQKGCLIEPKIYSGLYFLNKYNTTSKA